MILAACIVVLILFVASARFWRVAVWAALVLMIYEGALRKWLLPQFQEQIYFLKDLLLLGAYLGCFFGSRLMRNRPIVPRYGTDRTVRINWIVAIFACFCFLQMLNPRLPNWKVGLYGFASYLIYIPLMYIVPDLLPDERTFRRFVTLALIVCTVPLALGVVQFNLPPDHLLNRYAWSDQSVATFGSADHARVTSTFSYITGYSTFLVALGVFLLAAIAVERRTYIAVAKFALLLLTAANLLMTGSRGAVAQFALALPAFLWLAISRTEMNRAKVVIAGAVASVLVAAGVLTFFPEAHQAFTERAAAHTSENIDRVVQLASGPMDSAQQGGWTGYGIGATLPGSAFLYGPATSADGPPWVEAELEHVIIETGMVGLLLTLALRVLVPLGLFQCLRSGPFFNLRPWLVAALIFVALNLPMQIIVSRTAGMLYWFMAGLAFLPARWALSETQESCRLVHGCPQGATKTAAGGAC
jgi:hypothetical protein